MVSSENGNVAPVPQRQLERETAVRLYTETTLPVEDIATMLKVSRTTIHNWLNEAGTPKRGAMGPRGPRPPEMPEPHSELDRELAVLRAELSAAAALAQENSRMLSEVLTCMSMLQGTMNALLAVVAKRAPQ